MCKPVHNQPLWINTCSYPLHEKKKNGLLLVILPHQRYFADITSELMLRHVDSQLDLNTKTKQTIKYIFGSYLKKITRNMEYEFFSPPPPTGTVLTYTPKKSQKGW